MTDERRHDDKHRSGDEEQERPVPGPGAPTESEPSDADTQHEGHRIGGHGEESGQEPPGGEE